MTAAAPKTCPTCGLDAPPNATHCPHDGAVLVSGDEGTLIRDPLLGQTVGEYEVRRRIGAGGMGIVYECVHPIIGKRAAVKVLKPEVAEDPELMERLLSEARAVASIQHRAVIDIFGFGQLPDGRHYMVMEYLDGEPLDFLLHRVGRLPLLEALSILDSILSGLGAAHAVGVIHRDLKPSNVILVPQPDGSREVKVLDFGLAKQARPNEVTPQTVAGRVLGTPEYMAPEQARGLPIGPRTDLYAAGILAYELVLGQVPFSGASPVEVMLQQVNDAPPRPSAKDPSLPPAFDDLIGRLLAKDASERPANAEEVRMLVARIRTPTPTNKVRPSRPKTNAEGRGPLAPAPHPPLPADRTEPAGRTLPEMRAESVQVDTTLRELPRVAGKTDEVRAHPVEGPLPPIDQAATARALPRLTERRERATPSDALPAVRSASEKAAPHVASPPTTSEVPAPRSKALFIALGVAAGLVVAVAIWAILPSTPPQPEKPVPELSVDPANARTERAIGNLPAGAEKPRLPAPVVKSAPVDPTPAIDAGAAVATETPRPAVVAPVPTVVQTEEPRPAAVDAGTPAKPDLFTQKVLLARVREFEKRLGERDLMAAAFLDDIKGRLQGKPSAAERRKLARELDEWESRYLKSPR
ncbi:MAG: protein kinase [Myxococcota bacterium]